MKHIHGFENFETIQRRTMLVTTKDNIQIRCSQLTWWKERVGRCRGADGISGLRRYQVSGLRR